MTRSRGIGRGSFPRCDFNGCRHKQARRVFLETGEEPWLVAVKRVRFAIVGRRPKVIPEPFHGFVMFCIQHLRRWEHHRDPRNVHHQRPNKIHPLLKGRIERA